MPRARNFFVHSWGYRVLQRFDFWFGRQLQRPPAVTFQTYSQLSVGRTTVRMGPLREMQALLPQVRADRAGVESQGPQQAFVWPETAPVIVGAGSRGGLGAVLGAPLVAAGAFLGTLLYPSELGDATLPQEEPDPLFRHYTTAEGAAGFREEGVIRGRDGFVYVTPTIYTSGAAVQKALELRHTPVGYFEIPQSRLPGLTPQPPTSGGGIQFTAPSPVDATGLPFVPIGP